MAPDGSTAEPPRSAGAERRRQLARHRPARGGPHRPGPAARPALPARAARAAGRTPTSPGAARPCSPACPSTCSPAAGAWSPPVAGRPAGARPARPRPRRARGGRRRRPPGRAEGAVRRSVDPGGDPRAAARRAGAGRPRRRRRPRAGARRGPARAPRRPRPPPAGHPLVLQLDEPGLPAVLAARVPTSSGFATLRAPDAPARGRGAAHGARGRRTARSCTAARRRRRSSCCAAPAPRR